MQDARAEEPNSRQGDGVLVVDLDGTLISSDLLCESFWAGISRAPVQALVLLAMSGSRARLKRGLAGIADLYVAHLPYNADVLAYMTTRRAAGGKTALV